MAVINLGQVGPPRRSKLAGLADYSAELRKTRDVKEMAAQEEAGKEQRSVRTDATTRAGQEATLQAQLAKVRSDKETKNKAHYRKQLQQLADSSKLKQEQFLNQEGGKQWLKNVGKVLGDEAIGPDGKPILVNSQQRALNIVNTTKSTLLTKVRENGVESLSDNEKSSLEMINMAGEDVVAKAMEIVSKNPLFGMLSMSNDPEKKKKAGLMMANTIKFLTDSGARTGIGNTKNPYQNALGGGEGEQSAEDFLKSRGLN